VSNPPMASSPTVRSRMQATRRRDTRPELKVRSLLHQRGNRFRVDMPPLREARRRADIVFPRAKVAVYLDGCFWHACPQHATWPKANADWWKSKLNLNRQRDADTDARLAEQGWTVVRAWEHEDASEVADRIEAILHMKGL
jgi:DNA mismatch endonuclease (patch repair protein)